jgi:hypothetical protein
MSESIENLINELEDAISNREVKRARDLISLIGSQYEQQSAEEQKRIRQATILRGDDTLVDDKEQRLGQLVTNSAITEMKRGAFLIRAVSAVLEIEQDSTPDDSFGNAVSEVKEADENLKQNEQDSKSIIEESTIPPSVELVRLSLQTSTVQVGQSTQLEIILTNVGDKPADKVESTLKLDGGVAVSEFADQPNSLDGGEEKQLVYEIEGIETGEYRARFEATSENGGSDIDSITLTVEQDRDPVVEDYATENGLVTVNGLREAIADWRNTDITDELLSQVTTVWIEQKEVD